MTLTSGKIMIGLLAILVFIAIVLSAQQPIELRAPLSSTSHLQNTSSTLPILAEHMPAFQGISRWWNTADNETLSPEKLKGKVTIIDFWTYSCINCIRTQPVLKAWHQAYKNDGLVIVGVHTPEFAFEKNPDNVEAAIKKAGLEFPIALDAEYGTWNAYQNRYWPAKYVFDRQGRLRYVHFGEGAYDETEDVIRALLDEGGTVRAQDTNADSTPDFRMIQTHETYFGTARRENLSNAIIASDISFTTTLAKTIERDHWSLGGSWDQDGEKIRSKNQALFSMRINANAMHLVLGSDDGQKTFRVLIDGKNPTDEQLTSSTQKMPDGSVFITVSDQALYRIARFPDGGEHLIELKAIDPGIAFYAATFGE